MGVDISSQNYLEIFALEDTFHLDMPRLTHEYRQLQARYHPDKFVGADDRERRVALQYTSILNDAYETLKSPLRRAAYLLSLHGVDPEENVQAHLGGDFLLRQMQLREELEEIEQSESMEQLDAFKAQVEEETDTYISRFAGLYAEGQYNEAKPVYSRLQFLCKLHSEVDETEEKLLDY